MGDRSDSSNNYNIGGVVDMDTLDSGDSGPSSSSMITCNFNQDGSCLAVGTSTGFSVHNLYPYSSTGECYSSNGNTTTANGGGDGSSSTNDSRNISNANGGVAIIEMLFRCNLLAIVHSSNVPGGPGASAAGESSANGANSSTAAASSITTQNQHRVLIYDDHLQKCIGELTFRQSVINVKLCKDSIIIVLLDRIYVYNLQDLSLRDKIYTCTNVHGLLSLSTQVQHTMILACPAVTAGHVRIELYNLRKTMLIEAHESSLRNIELTADGTFVATASEKGTVLRVFDVRTSVCVHELRRGVERASITCLSFSFDNLWLCCTSDKGTTHIFNLSDDDDTDVNTSSCPSTTRSGRSNTSSSSTTSYTKMLFNTVRKTVIEGSESSKRKKSMYQIRGVHYPTSCTFVVDTSTTTPNSTGVSSSSPTASLNHHIVAIAGYDADGNGVLLLSEFPKASPLPQQHDELPRRLAYHVLCKSALSIPINETEDARRRRRMHGWSPADMLHGKSSAAAAALEHGMEQIQFEDAEDDDEFISITTIKPVPPPTLAPTLAPTIGNEAIVPMHSGNSSRDPSGNDNVENACNATSSSSKLHTAAATNISTTDSNRLPLNASSSVSVTTSTAQQHQQNQQQQDAATTTTIGDSMRTEKLDDDSSPSSSTSVEV